jgi:hypothetical protein
VTLEAPREIHARRKHGQTSKEKNEAEDDGQRTIENEKATPNLIEHLKATVIHE